MPDGDPAANRIAPDAPATARHLARISALAARHSVRPEDLDDAVHAALLGTASAERGLAGVTRFLDVLPSGSPAVRVFLERPRFAQGLATLFSGSPFLGEILLQHPEDAEALLRIDRDASRRRASQHLNAALAAMAPLVEPAAQLDALRRLQRLEYVRIGYADLAGLWDLAAVTVQLSALAEGLIGAVLGVCARVEGVGVGGLAIVALGKLGGAELNYSSDVDLVFLAEAPTPEWTRLARTVVDALSRSTAAGYLYRVDLRLRPWGRTGPLVTGVEAFLDYLRGPARPWERQALLRARTVAGDRALGAGFLREAHPLLFAATGGGARAQVAGQKRLIDEGLRARGRAWGEVKSGVGSIRDVEFLVQYLQLAHGAARPEVLSPNTPEALGRLRAAGLLSADDYRALAEGYTFLRPLEHYLQLLDYGQRHALPRDPEALDYLARRLGFRGERSGEALLTHYARHSAAVRAAYERYLGEPDDGRGAGSAPPATDREAAAEHVLRMAPSYRATFGDAEIARHAQLAEGLGPERLAEIHVEPVGERRWRVEVVGYDYPGELALICGLLLAYGLDIESGQVFTYEGEPTSGARRDAASRSDVAPRRKIVDTFIVRAEHDLTNEDWERYADDLRALLGLLEAGRADEAHGALARRVAGDARSGAAGPARALAPLSIAVRNDLDAAHTVLAIEGPDTPGFLYALANALSVAGHYIARVTVETVGARARDVLHITDAAGGRVEGERRERELRATTVLVKHFTHLLPLSPDPQRALSHLRGFLARLFAEEDWPARVASVGRPEVLTALARLLGVSDALWEDLLRLQYGNLFPVLEDVEALANTRTRADLDRELADLLAGAPDSAAARERLNAFKDREMFRVDMRHIQEHTTEFGTFSAELGDVAEAVLSAALGLAYEALGEAPAPAPPALALLGLGKLGGRELGYASDVELLFVYADPQTPARPEVAEFHERLVAEFLATIRSRRAGIFRIDLRLRPYGAAGSLAVSLEAFRRYYGPDGPAWPYERQALVKLRAVAGDTALGARVEALRDEIVYGGAPFDAVAMRAMRERQLRHLVPGGALNAKFSSGGLVDVEYLVQGLQMRHGASHAEVRRVNTLDALDALAALGSLDRVQHADLRAAYILLRRIIDALRIVRGNADDLTLPPEGDEEWLYLARRMGNGEHAVGGADAGGEDAAAALLRRRLSDGMARVAALSGELLGA